MLAVVCFGVAVALVIWKFLPEYKAYIASPKDGEVSAITVTCNCGTTYQVNLNKFLLFVFPPKVYLNYGVEHLKPWVDPEAKPKKRKKVEEK